MILGPGSPVGGYTGRNARVYASALQNFTDRALYRQPCVGKMQLVNTLVMTVGRPLPPLETLQEHLSYNEITGKLHWLTGKGGKKVGDIVGSFTDDGYIRFTLQGKQWLAHRVAWALHTGEDPGVLVVDHINGQRHDNRIVNLRLLTHVENTEVGKRKHRKVLISYPSGEKVVVGSVKDASKLLNRREWRLIKAMRREDNQLYTGPGSKTPTGIRVSYA